MPQQKLNTLTTADTSYKGYLLIRTVSFGRAKNNKPFVSLIFMDPSGTIPAKVWNTPEERFPYQAGEVVRIDADVDFFNDEPQLIINTIDALSDDDPKNNVGYYLQTAPMSVTKMRRVINDALDNIQNPMYANIAQTFLAKEPRGNKFEEHPAAKSIHHAYFRGLMYHTTRMLQQANSLVGIYKGLNTDLLYTSVLIHDLGKLVEITSVPNTEYTVSGTILGHISIVDGWLVEYGVQNDTANSEDFQLLRHTILSHHGELEYGSPVRPMIPEAQLLHMIDNVDAKLTLFEDTLENTNPGELSKRVYALDNRMVYNNTRKEMDE